jgi:hypothetical protein
MRALGKDIPFQEIRMQIGKGGDQLVPVFMSKAELDNYGEQISKRRGEIFKENYLREVKAFSRVRDLFQRVLADGKKKSPSPHRPLARNSRHIKKLRTSWTYSTPKRPPMMQSNQSHILTSS